MSNVILYDHKDNIIHFIKNCKKTANRTYVGSNCKIKAGCKLQEKWINEEPTPIYKEEMLVGYEEKASDFNEITKFYGEVVSTKEEVNRTIVNKIREQYSLEEELKLHRLKLSGDLTATQWNDYTNTIEKLKSDGDKFQLANRIRK